jgi:hypothetical protein
MDICILEKINADNSMFLIRRNRTKLALTRSDIIIFPAGIAHKQIQQTL